MAERITALTYADEDRETPPVRVEGTLYTRQVESLGYTQYLVERDDGSIVVVDPTTVKSLDAPEGDDVRNIKGDPLAAFSRFLARLFS